MTDEAFQPVPKAEGKSRRLSLAQSSLYLDPNNYPVIDHYDYSEVPAAQVTGDGVQRRVRRLILGPNDENLLAPPVAAGWSTRWHHADPYLNAHAQPADPVMKKRAAWLKAQINVTGQFLFPGDAMTLVIDRQGLSASHFDGQESKQLVPFL
jgi:hypothetical protein